MGRQRSLAAVVVAALFLPSVLLAADVALPLRSFVNKPGRITKFVALGDVALPAPGTADPTIGGAELSFFSGPEGEVIDLPAANWSGLGDPPGVQGFIYRDPSGASCRVILVKRRVVKGSCRPTTAGAPTHDVASDAAVSVVLALGAGEHRYCGACGTDALQRGNPGKVTNLTACSAPISCADSPPTPTATATATPTNTATPIPTTGIACGDADYPTCGGDCPAGQVCSARALMDIPEGCEMILDGTGCACMPSDSVCGGGCTIGPRCAAVCDREASMGVCGAGEACVFVRSACAYCQGYGAACRPVF